ncbi:MAG: RNA polymerase sigma factor [Proteobacteria bacterium]|nr:RNA polymerase sigma factor [Pseudomonadota bacterium]
MTEARLLRRAQAGDRGALDRLLRQELRAVRQAAWRVLGADSELDDVTQKALIEAVRSLQTFRGDCRFRTWLTRIAIRVAWTHLRARSKIIPLTPAIEEAQHSDRGHARTEAHSELCRLQRCLNQLPPEQRVVFTLRDLEGYTTGEIARLLEIPEGTVSTRLRTARLRIREHLSAPVALPQPRQPAALQRLESNAGRHA